MIRPTHRHPNADAADAITWSEREVEMPGRSPGTIELEAIEAPVRWSDLAVSTVARHYFVQYPPESRERSVRKMISRVTSALGAWAVQAGHAVGEEQRLEFEFELITLVLAQRATFATPVWLNVGVSDQPITSACFILSVADSMHDLLDWNAHEGLIFQQGAGSGTNLSAVRSSREPVSRGGLASGPVSFMRGADAWAASIRSGGRARRSARMIVLDVDHPDVMAFIRSKQREEERARVLVGAGYGPEEAEQLIAFQQGTHALRVSDEFMRAATEHGTWELHAVTTGEVMEVVDAHDLLRACAEACWDCGDPGLQFETTINSWHTCPNSGPINASNPCGEYLSIDNSACNLATLNLLGFLAEDGEFGMPEFISAVETMLTAQDVLVSGSGYPTSETMTNAQRFRQLGLGHTNLAALLLMLGLPYDSDEARAWAAAITALMGGVAYRRSAELARTLGPFPEFERNREPMLAIIDRHRAGAEQLPESKASEPIVHAARTAWDEAARAGRAHGFRNAQTTLIAPYGTTSLMMDCDTTGIEPYYSLAATKQFTDGNRARLECRALGPALARLGYSKAEIGLLVSYAADHGHLEDASALRAEHQPLFATATSPRPITPSAHLQMVAAVQQFISGGVSKTLNLLHEATVDDVESTFVSAWSLGLKSMSIYRQSSKIVQPLSARPN